MSVLSMDIARMVEMLPESDQHLAHELVKKLVLAWDPDFTKLTPAEAEELREAEEGEFIDEDEIDWDNLDKYVDEN